jgi:hypothetical protein
MIGQSPQPADSDGVKSPETPPPAQTPAPPRPREIGGREGPEPTRYGDWEKDGRCIDF